MRTAYVYNFLLEANIMASIAIVLMIVLRKTLRKPLGSRALCFGWLMVAIRLLCPLSLPNPLIASIRPGSVGDGAIRPIGGQVLVRTRDALSDLYVFTRVDMGIAEENAVAGTIRSAYMGMWNGNFPQLLMWVYLIVFALIVLWFVYCNVRFLVHLKKSRVDMLPDEIMVQYHALCAKMLVKPLPVYLCDPLPGACLAGVFNPFIALPVTIKKEDMLLTLEHELCHYKNRDHLYALVRLLCCAVHWFNPLVWLAAHVSRTDMEMRCDEHVTKDKTEAEKKTYATLLVTSAARRMAPGLSVAATGMTMTAKRLKSRVEQILSARQAIRALSITFALLCSVLLIGAFATGEHTKQARIPAFKSDMQPALVPFDDYSGAKEIAKTWAAMPMLDADVEDAKWSVKLSGDGRGVYLVQTMNHPARYFAMIINEDGSVRSVSNKPQNYYDMTAWYTNNLSKKVHRDAMEYAYAWAMQMNPAWEGKLSKTENVQDFRVGDRHYIYMEMPVLDEDYAYVHATLQVLPEFKVIEIGGGNG